MMPTLAPNTQKTSAANWGAGARALPLLLLWVAAALQAACAADEAPQKIDDVSSWLWRNFDTASDEEMANAFVSLGGVVTPVTADEPLKALIDRLKGPDVALVGRSDGDPAKAVGMLVITDIACKISQVNAIHVHDRQDELHAGAYKSYKRTYKGNRDDYLAGKAARLEWNTELESDYAREKLAGAMRRIPDLGKERSPFGTTLVSRTFLSEPATKTHWPQDYQIDAYFERKPGRVVHLFAVWREAEFSGLSSENSGLQNIQMKGFVDWDKEVEKACASGKF